MTTTDVVCRVCGRPLISRAYGWAHEDGGGSVWLCCPSCGWQGSSPDEPAKCPECDAPLRDDHVAQPQDK